MRITATRVPEPSGWFAYAADRNRAVMGGRHALLSRVDKRFRYRPSQHSRVIWAQKLAWTFPPTRRHSKISGPKHRCVRPFGQGPTPLNTARTPAAAPNP